MEDLYPNPSREEVENLDNISPRNNYGQIDEK